GAATRLTAFGNGGAVHIVDGRLDADKDLDLANRVLTSAQRGVAIVASSTFEIDSIAASIGAGGNVGLAGAVTTNLLQGETTAHVGDDARINDTVHTTGAGASVDQDVSVAAYHHNRLT